MELYTIVSLIIGIFGATYAALNALRSYYEPKINKAKETSLEVVTRLTETLGAAHKRTGHCQKHSNTINRWQTCWRWAHALPTLGFALFILFIGIWTLISWSDVTVQHLGADLAAKMQQFPWSWMRGGLCAYLTGNTVAFIVAVIAYSKCSTSEVMLSEHDEDKDKKRFSPPNGLSEPVTTIRSSGL